MKSFLIFIKSWWFVILLLLAGLHIAFFQVFGYDFSRIIGDLGDSRFIISIVEYNYQWAVGNYDNYWDGFFMFPDKEVISYSDNLLGITPFYALIRLLETDYLTAFQLLILICHVLNYATAFFVLNKFVNNKYAAATGAFIFAFSLALNGIHNHPQFTFRFCIPLFFYFLHLYLENTKLKSLLLAAVFLIFQFYLGVYLGYFLAFFGGLYFVGFNMINYKNFTLPTIKAYAGHFAIVIFAGVLLLLPIFYFYYKRNQVTGYYTDFNQVLATIPQIPSYFKAYNGSVAWKSLNATPVLSQFEWFHYLFPGALVLFSLMFSIYLAAKGYTRKTIFSIFILLAFVFLLTTNFNGNTLYDNLLHIPGFKAIRVVSRLILVLIFFFSWLVTITIAYLLNRSEKAARIIIALLPVFLVIDNYCQAASFKTFGKTESRRRTGAIANKVLYNSSGKNFAAFAYIPSTNEEAYKIQIDAMLCAVELKTKTVNGYSSSCAGNFGPVWELHDSISVVNWLKEMRVDPAKVLLIK